MSVTPPTEVARPPRGGLAVKLFAILLLLGVVAILVTGILGYVRGRDALEAAVYGSVWGRLAYQLRHWLRRNSRRGSRRNARSRLGARDRTRPCSSVAPWD